MKASHAFNYNFSGLEAFNDVEEQDGDGRVTKNGRTGSKVRPSCSSTCRGSNRRQESALCCRFDVTCLKTI